MLHLLLLLLLLLQLLLLNTSIVATDTPGLPPPRTQAQTCKDRESKQSDIRGKVGEVVVYATGPKYVQ